MWQEVRVNRVDSHLRYSLVLEGYFHFSTCSCFYLLKSDFHAHLDQVALSTFPGISQFDLPASSGIANSLTSF